MLIVFCYQAQSSGQWGHPCQLIILKVAVAQSVIMLGRICSWQTWSSLWHECTPLVSALRSPISLPGLRELVVFVLLKNQTTLVQLSRKVRQKKSPENQKNLSSLPNRGGIRVFGVACVYHNSNLFIYTNCAGSVRWSSLFISPVLYFDRHSSHHAVCCEDDKENSESKLLLCRCLEKVLTEEYVFKY